MCLSVIISTAINNGSDNNYSNNNCNLKTFVNDVFCEDILWGYLSIFSCLFMYPACLDIFGTLGDTHDQSHPSYLSEECC